MKITTIFIVFLCVSSSVYTQSKIKYYNYKWQETIAKYGAFYSVQQTNDTAFIREDYYAATNTLQMSGAYKDSTEKIRIGKFYWFHPNGKVSRVGNHVNGKREGTWVSFYENGIMEDSVFYKGGKQIGNSFSWYRSGFQEDSTTRTNDTTAVSITWFDGGGISSAGRYINSKKNGKWNYYHRNGEKSATEVYESGNLKSKIYYSEQGEIVDTTLFADIPAQFGNSSKSWASYLSKNLYSPANVKLVNTDKIVVVVRFDINENGKVVNAIVTTPFHTEYDEIALKIIRNSPKWIPARYKNRYLTSGLSQAIFFQETEE